MREVKLEYGESNKRQILFSDTVGEMDLTINKKNDYRIIYNRFVSGCRQISED